LQDADDHLHVQLLLRAGSGRDLDDGDPLPVVPGDLEQMEAGPEALQRRATAIDECDARARDELAHDVRDQDLAAARASADPGGGVHRRAEQELALDDPARRR
jgi:hypothetical protein